MTHPLAAHDRTCNWVFGTSPVLLVTGLFGAWTWLVFGVLQ